jgi:hypothetical protein
LRRRLAMSAQRLSGVDVCRAPHLLQQCFVGQQPSAILGQDREELELDRCKVDRLTVAAHDACREVDFQTAQLHA